MYIQQQKGCHTFTVKLKKYPYVELKGQCHEISDPVLSNNYQRPGPIMNRKNQFGKLFRISMQTTACLFNAASPCRHPLSMQIPTVHCPMSLKTPLVHVHINCASTVLWTLPVQVDTICLCRHLLSQQTPQQFM